MSTTIDWFRRPTGEDPGTLNACYNALDRHVIRGRAESVAVVLEGREWTYAELLAEVGAFAGVLRAFGTAPGDRVALGRLPETQAVTAELAVARLGAIAVHGDAGPEPVRIRVVATSTDLGEDQTPLITVDDTTELSWAVVMRAGRTDPAPCADVPGDAVLRVVDGRPIAVLDGIDTLLQLDRMRSQHDAS